MKFVKNVLLLLLVCYAGLLFASSPKPTSDAKSVLFTQLAQSASIQSLSKQNWYQMTLNNVASDTAWFSDRPVRRHGKLTTERFVQLWRQGNNDFAQDPPNANLVFLSTTKQGLTETHEHIVKLTQPVYQASAHSLSYQIELLPPVHKIAVGQTKQVALFIDSRSFAL